KRPPGIARKPRKGYPGKLNETHTPFLTQFVNQNPTVVLADTKKSLCEAFEDLAISGSALHRHLVYKCYLTLKKLEKLPAARTLDKQLYVGNWLLVSYDHSY
ncbi:hypothetical protein EDC05_001261, partial [Coemansia umbellata]